MFGVSQAPDNSKNMDDVAWLNLFIQLTGGVRDVVTENRSRTNLSHIDETTDEVDNQRSVLTTPIQGIKFKRKSVDERPIVPEAPRATRLSLPTLSAPRLSLTDTDRLLEANERSIEIEKLEKYILGKKSVELEIEFGIPRSQLVRYIDEGLSVGFIKSVIFRAVSKLRKEDQNNDGKIRKFQSLVHEIKYRWHWR